MRIQLINTHVVYHSEPEMKLIQPYRTANPSDTLRIMVDHYPSINVRTNTTDATIISVGESEMCALGIHVIDTLLVPTQFFNSNNIPEQLSQLQQELSGNYGNNDSLPMVQVREYKAGPETGGNMVDLDMNRNLYAYISLLQNLGLMQYLTQVPTPVTILAYRSATVDEIYQISSELDQDDKQGIQKRIIQATVLPNVREVLEGGMYLSVGEDVIQFSTEDGNRTKVSVYPYQRDQNTQQVLQSELDINAQYSWTYILQKNAYISSNLTIHILEDVLVPYDVFLSDNNVINTSYQQIIEEESVYFQYEYEDQDAESENCESVNLTILSILLPQIQHHAFMMMVNTVLPDTFWDENRNRKMTVFALNQDGIQDLQESARLMGVENYTEFVHTVLQYHIVVDYQIQEEEVFSGQAQVYPTSLQGNTIVSSGSGKIVGSGTGVLQIEGGPLSQQCGVTVYSVEGLLIPIYEIKTSIPSPFSLEKLQSPILASSNFESPLQVSIYHSTPPPPESNPQLTLRYTYSTYVSQTQIELEPHAEPNSNSNLYLDSNENLVQAQMGRYTEQNDSTHLSSSYDQNQNLESIDEYGVIDAFSSQQYWTTSWSRPSCTELLDLITQQSQLSIFLQMIQAGRMQNAFENLKNVTLFAFQDQGIAQYLEAANMNDLKVVPLHLLQVWLGYNIVTGNDYITPSQIRQTLTYAPSGQPLEVQCQHINSSGINPDRYLNIVGSWNQIIASTEFLQACNDVNIYFTNAPLVPLNAQIGR
eukprot:TRINITY_DN22990_c0_g1_i1.p1 TRINITY_DN22990_c0_g1~~TRINITY_DN22990_c0_g1_i1.p1  ORF type:complete len:857 (-),score=68.17 TRINITY_DN22990_c0_g1_i1:5586-7868(-)